MEGEDGRMTTLEIVAMAVLVGIFSFTLGFLLGNAFVKKEGSNVRREKEKEA